MKTINVGIDLGTTYSAIASFSKEDGQVKVYKNREGKDCTPSVVCFSENGVVIGDEAKDEQKSGNINTISFYKSMMGDPDWTAYLNGDEYSAEQLSGIFLKELVAEVERENNVKIEGAVITVPAYFNDKQREATIRAGQKAGLRVLKIINEPTAAIIAYGLTSGKDKNVMVYDLGGGTFDVTIAHVSGTKINVMATNGNHQLGGKDWDETLLADIKERFFDENGISIDDHPEDLKELQVKCEEAKKRLSSVSSTQISIQCEGILGKYSVTREDFDDKTYSLLYETILLINSCFDEITENQERKFGWSDIDEVVLVGGSTRMPQVKDMIIKEYGRPPITKDINVDTIVATGAAMQAELCVSNTITLTVANKSSSTTGTTKPTMMSLVINNSDIQDITAHSLGMLALANNEKSYINSIIIKKNSKVNESFSREYTFGGEKLQVYVLQGESRDPYDCDIIGAYSITGMPSNTKNKIIVNFLYNSNGVVEVNACLGSGQTLSTRKEKVNESMGEIIARLEKEKKDAEEAAKRNSRVEIMLIIDTSGSMWETDGPGGSYRMDEAKRSAKDFVNQFNSNSVYMSVVAFADKAVYACKWTNQHTDIIRAIERVDTVHSGATGGTPINDRMGDFTGNYPHIMVILTDGEWFKQSEEIAAAKKAKSRGITIYGIGIGNADASFLNSISSGKGLKVDISKLNETFKEVASSIATEVVGNPLK